MSGLVRAIIPGIRAKLFEAKNHLKPDKNYDKNNSANYTDEHLGNSFDAVAGAGPRLRH
ncbi:MAG TPA: hypothetical protein VIK53_16975 [Verrucomicrobiae bacterium]